MPDYVPDFPVGTVPTQRELRLVLGLARALEQYHGERRGSLACWIQAATILSESVLQKYQPKDFFVERNVDG